MNNTFFRLVPAMALGLPLLALAQAARPDPADPKAAAPALSYLSAWADYKPWQDLPPGDWRAVNDTVRGAAPQGGSHTGHGVPSTGPGSVPVPAAKPSVPSGPAPGGEHPHGGKP